MFAVGIAGLAAVSALVLASAFGGAPASPSGSALSGGRLIESAFEALRSQTGEDRASSGSQMSTLRLASLPTQVTADTASAGNERQTASGPAADRASFDERFNSFGRERFASFDERFAAAAAGEPKRTRDWLASAELRVETPNRENDRLALRGALDDAPAERAASAGATPDKPLRLAYAPSDALPSDALRADRGRRTAIYDISARVVYMPNGERLEAHSGFGEHMDDLRSIRLRNKGVTPPNVYKLSLREKLFHGVRAVRLTPVDPAKMYGRDGFLVHSYLLGPTGESNGCVSISDYNKFLHAFLKGKVDRLVVVERLADPPPAEPGNWLAEQIRTLREAS